MPPLHPSMSITAILSSGKLCVAAHAQHVCRARLEVGDCSGPFEGLGELGQGLCWLLSAAPP